MSQEHCREALLRVPRTRRVATWSRNLGPSYIRSELEKLQVCCDGLIALHRSSCCAVSSRRWRTTPAPEELGAGSRHYRDIGG